MFSRDAKGRLRVVGKLNDHAPQRANLALRETNFRGDVGRKILDNHRVTKYNIYIIQKPSTKLVMRAEVPHDARVARAEGAEVLIDDERKDGGGVGVGSVDAIDGARYEERLQGQVLLRQSCPLGVELTRKPK